MHLGFTSEVASALLGREAYVGGGIQQWREAAALWQGQEAHTAYVERSFRDAIDIALLCDHDIVRASYWRHDVKPTGRLDEHTYLYQYGDDEDWRVLDYDPASEQCRITPYRPATRAEPTFGDLERQIAAQEDAIEDYQPRQEDYELQIRAQRLLGHERVVRVDIGSFGIDLSPIWLEATILRPDLVARSLDIAVERLSRNVEFLAPFGFGYFFGGADIAGNHGPMISPQTFARLVLPRLKRITDICHKYHHAFIFTSDGNLWPVAHDLFGASGVDGYAEIDRRAGMDLGKLRQRFPHLTLIGNISSHTVHKGRREEAITETLSCIEEAKRRHGIVVGASNYFVPGTPIQNVIAVLEVIEQHR
jgi:hypothetical protein